MTLWLKIQTILNTTNHCLIGAIGVYVTLLARSLQFEGTAMHMFLTVIGFHILGAEALMSHYPCNMLTKCLTYHNKSRYHGILQLIGGSMALVGALSKIQTTEQHFTTWHGKIGLMATFMCLASLIGGFLNYFQPKFIHFLYTRAEVKFRHNFFGMITFTLAMTTILLGYWTQFFIKYVDNQVIPGFILTTFLVYITTMIAPMNSFLYKLKIKYEQQR